MRARVSLLAEKVADMLDKIRLKYDEYHIDQPPFVIVKADAGTYGMGIMTVKSPDDVRELNRKQRKRWPSARKDSKSAKC